MTTYLMDGYQQSDDPNKNWKKLALFIFIVIATCVLASFLFGCNPLKKIERAEQTVLNNPSSEKKVGLKWLENNKCANDTVLLHDTTILTKEVHHTKVDTTYSHDTTFVFYTDTAFYEKRIYKDKIVVDHQREKQLQDSINILLQQKAALNQNVIDAHSATETEKKDKNKWLWLFIAACAAFSLSNGLWIYGKIKSGAGLLKL